MVVGAIIGAGILAAGAIAWSSASSANKQMKAQKSLAEDARNQAKYMEDKAEAAELEAETAAKDEARRRLKGMTKTTLTSGLGDEEEANVKQTVLGG